MSTNEKVPLDIWATACISLESWSMPKPKAWIGMWCSLPGRMEHGTSGE
jgi:hypothetical protein